MAEIKISRQAKKRIGCFDPRKGMKRRAGRKVPIMLPIVPIENTFPEVLPIFLLSVETNLMIYGLVTARKVMGIMKSNIMVKNEARRIVRDELWLVKGLRIITEANGLTKKGTIKKRMPAERIM